jgi:hypothetical protein
MKKLLVLAALLLSPVPTLAASPEDAYIAARDGHIAAFKKTADAKNMDARIARQDKALKELEQKLKAIVGPFALKGYPAQGKINLDTLFSEDEGFGMLDGLVYGETESAKSVVVTTDGLLDKWLAGRREESQGKANAPIDAGAAVKTDTFYSQAVSTDSAVIQYAEIPLVKPDGAKFVYATLSTRTQDEIPKSPDQLFLALERGGRVFVVNEKLSVPMPPIAACEAVKKGYDKKVAEAYDKKDADAAQKLRDEADGAFRSCYGEKAKDEPAFKAATDQARAIVEALPAK